MKRIYTLFLLLAVSFAAKSQILLTEGFEGTFPPTGWTILNDPAGSANMWTYNTDPNLGVGPYTPHSGAGSMVYEYDPLAAANTWAFTPGLSLTAGTSYSLTFWYAVRSSFYPEKMKVTVGDAATIAAQTNILWDNAGGTELSNTTWAQAIVQYTPTTTGTYYFSFNCYSDADEFAMFVDDVQVQVTPGSAPNCTTTISPANGTTGQIVDSVTFAWNSAAGATGYNLYIGVANPPTTLITTVTDTFVTLYGAAPGTTYYWYVEPLNAAGTATGCAAAADSFTTVAGPSNDTLCNATPLFLNGAEVCGNTALANATGFDDPDANTYSCSTANNTEWFQYTPTTTGPVGIRLRNSASSTNPLDAWVVPFTATGTCPSLTLTQVGSCQEFDLTTNDSVIMYDTVTLVAGTTYYFMVDGVSGAVGEYCISLVTPPAPPTCTGMISPANGAINVSAPNDTFYWHPAANATGYAFYLGTTSPPDSLGVATDTAVVITGLASNTTYYWMVAPVNGGGVATGCTIYSFTTTTYTPPANDTLCNAVELFVDGAEDCSSTVLAATTGFDDPTTFSCSTPNNTVWYKYTPSISGPVGIRMKKPANSTNPLNAWVVPFEVSGACPSLTPTQFGSCQQFDLTTADSVILYDTTTLVAGTTYYFMVDGFSGAIGDFCISLVSRTLPITLTNFKGVKDGAVNMLSWTTATEQNNRGFELQRSADGATFTTLAFVETKAMNGNSASAINYAYADRKPFAGNSYYRLKQVDKDGKATLSNVILIKGDKVNSIVMSSVYPNPAKSKVNVVLTAPSSDKVSLVVTDIAGKVVLSQPVQLVSGDNNIALSISNLPSGTYMVKAVCSNCCETTASKLVKE